MNAAVTRKEIAAALADRFGHIFQPLHHLPVETISSGIAPLDDVIQGFPRGAITEIHGARSSGRTSLLLSALAAATAQEESCALVDCDDTFDISSAAASGVDCDRVLWVRCGHDLERAFKSVDLILHAGGFGFVALNLCDVSRSAVRRIVSSWWFRFRRAIENTSTALIVLTRIAALRSCASVVLQVKKKQAEWNIVTAGHNLSTPLMIKAKSNSHLTLVPALPSGRTAAQAQFLQALELRIEPQKPLECYDQMIEFRPQVIHHSPICGIR